MTEFTSLFLALIFLMAVGASVFLLLFFGCYLAIAFYRHRDREKKSLAMVCLQVAVPRDNEIKPMPWSKSLIVCLQLRVALVR